MTTSEAPPQAGNSDGEVLPHVRPAGIPPPAQPRREGAAALMSRRPPGHLGPVNVAQLLLLELTLVAVLIALRRHPPIVFSGVSLGIVVLAGTFGWHRGRWWAEYPGLFWRYHRRRRGSAHAPASDRRLTLLHELAPDLTVQTVEGSDGVQVGVGTDGAGSFALLAAGQSDGVCAPARSVPLHVLARAVTDAQQPGLAVQVVTHTIPAPRSTATEPALCDASYAELLAPVGGAAPADQLTWVAVRLDKRAVAESTIAATPPAGDRTPSDLVAFVAVLIRRVGKALRRAGCGVKILDADGLLDAVVRSTDLDPESVDPTVGDGPGPREGWQSWQSVSLAQACFWLHSWPRLTDAGPLLERLATTPAEFTSIATVLQPDRRGTPGAVEIRALIRLAADAETLSDSCGVLNRAAAEAGARLVRLDGEHAPAVYASAPTGGGAL
jgi:type VII secretion protein EccE